MQIPQKFSFFYWHLRSDRPIHFCRTRAVNARDDEGGVRVLAHDWVRPPRRSGPGSPIMDLNGLSYKK